MSMSREADKTGSGTTPCAGITTHSCFWRETTVNIDINASVENVFKIMTDGSNYPKWNRAVTKIEGEIKEDSSIKLTSGYTFDLRIIGWKENEEFHMVNSMANREFIFTKKGPNSMNFKMTERLGAPLWPCIKCFVPDFDPLFGEYAEDLKKEAEK